MATESVASAAEDVSASTFPHAVKSRPAQRLHRDQLLSAVLCLLFTACIARLWLMPLRSSFWIDEMGTVFVVEHGRTHPSLAAVPQIPLSVYYALPQVAQSLFGFSEEVYRLPSLLALGCALVCIVFVARRILPPAVGWFVAFGCLALKGFDYQASDARPYAVGTCVAAASILFLVRWLDDARWIDAGIFLVLAALLWRIHLVYWPFYFIFAVYGAYRVLRRETGVKVSHFIMVSGVLGLALIPVALDAFTVLRGAASHVVVSKPSIRDLAAALKFGLIGGTCAVTALLARISNLTPTSPVPGRSSLILMGSWWLAQPLSLFGFSWLTGNSLFLDRYLSIALPGAVLVAALMLPLFVPRSMWKPLTIVLAVGVFIFIGEWKTVWPVHTISNWKLAAEQIRALPIEADTPILCPSPFIEAKAPVWSPQYPLPGFLYSHLSVYPVGGKTYTLPFEMSPEAARYARWLIADQLAKQRLFVIYGGAGNVWLWTGWLSSKRELRDWTTRHLGPFGDVDAVVFQRATPTD